MKREIIKSLTKDFEAHSNKTANDIEFWFARDLQQLLGYTKWDNFLKVITKAKISCEAASHEVQDHFADVGKMITIGSGTEREIKDVMLTRFACYFIAQNGDPQKEAIWFHNQSNEKETWRQTQPTSGRFPAHHHHQSQRFRYGNYDFQCQR